MRSTHGKVFRTSKWNLLEGPWLETNTNICTSNKTQLQRGATVTWFLRHMSNTELIRSLADQTNWNSKLAFWCGSESNFGRSTLIISEEFSLHYLSFRIIMLQLHLICNDAAVAKSACESNVYTGYTSCMQTKLKQPAGKCIFHLIEMCGVSWHFAITKCDDECVWARWAEDCAATACSSAARQD